MPADATSVLTRILRHAERNPDEPAVVVGQEILTYGQLSEKSAALARQLVAAGAGPWKTVVLRMRQSVGTVVGMLASLRVGAAWTVAEPSQPEARLRALFDSTACVCTLTEADTGLQDEAGFDRPGIPEGVPAYLVLTSGSTGVAKAVMTSREQLATYVTAMSDRLGDDLPRRCLVPARLSWDGGIGDLMRTLASGGLTVIPDESQLRNPVAVVGLGARWQATSLVAAPSFYQLLLDHIEPLAPHLRVVIVGGEQCPAALVRRHRELLGNVPLHNVFGQTETTVDCVSARIDTVTGDDVPIGRPVDGTTVHVLDAALRPVSTGEVYIGGRQVALGYAGQPSRTAERFVADPFAADPGARMYRTGDVASIAPDGALLFGGRVDRQVQVRGVRVELAEIETVLGRHPGVAEVVCHFDAGSQSLVAYCVFRSGYAPGHRELREFCRTELVEQAIPMAFTGVEAIPLNDNGKTDHAALRESRVDDQVRPGWTPTQRKLAHVWASVLRHDESGLRDNFFEMGGDSRRVVDLHIRLQRSWPGVLGVGELFDLASIESQAMAITARTGGEPPRATTTGPSAHEV
jgi:amino acid adenylation domain-containing protein